MKKHKSVVAILLAVMMIFTFMPTMAFAAEATSAGHTYGTNSPNAVDVTYAGLKVLVAPTCTEEGVGEIYCTIDMNGEPCGAVKTVKINALGHKGGKQVKMTVAQVMDYFKLNADAKKNYLSSHPTYCEKYVYVCDQCGALVYKENNGTWTAYPSINYVLDIDPNPWVHHVEPTDVKGCAETYTCAECGATDVPRTNTKDHTWATTTTQAHVQANDARTYVEVVTRECTECGKVETSTRAHGRYSSNSSRPLAIPHGTTTDVEIPSLTPCDSRTPIVVQHVCTECGMVVTKTNKVLPHTYQTTLPYKKQGDNTYMYVKDECVVCGAEKPNSERAVGYAPDASDSVTYEAASAANCEQGSFIIQTTTTASGVAARTVFSDTEVKAATNLFEKLNDKWYVKATKAELPFTEAMKHDFEAMSNYAAPTCTQAGFDARVCKKCGKVDHASIRTTEKALGHDVKEVVVPATCGEGGYTYKVCARCNEYLDKAGKTAAENGQTKPYAAPQKYNETKSVKAPGTKCTYEWQVLEEATAFKLGTRAKVCTECGHMEEATKESIAKKTIPAPTVKALKKKAKVSFKAVEGATKYQILVNGKVVKKNAKAGKTYTIKKKNLKLGKKNKFQVVAINAAGEKATSAAKSVKIKKK